MTEPQRRLLDRILESPQFAHAVGLKRILQYLCDHSAEGSLKEYDIALGAIGRADSFDPKTDPIVRVSISTIRERLRAYFEAQGRNELLRLTIPKGEYRASFFHGAAAQPAPPAAEFPPSLRRFWKQYVSGGAANILIYTDLLFFRDEAGNYVRNIYVNDLAAGLDDLQQRLQFTPPRDMRPSYHFLSAGEVHAMLSLVRLFERFRVPLESRNSRFSAWNELHRANLILLGSSRTNPFLDSLQGGNNFTINATEILKIWGENRTRVTGLFLLSFHGYEHYGNMVTYMRLKGLVPPSSEPRK